LAEPGVELLGEDEKRRGNAARVDGRNLLLELRMELGDEIVCIIGWSEEIGAPRAGKQREVVQRLKWRGKGFDSSRHSIRRERSDTEH
jgi:hypothetical protein